MMSHFGALLAQISRSWFTLLYIYVQHSNCNQTSLPGFLFSSGCVVKMVGANSKCPECGSFAWVKNLKTNRQLANVATMCFQLKSLVRNDCEEGNDSQGESGE